MSGIPYGAGGDVGGLSHVTVVRMDYTPQRGEGGQLEPHSSHCALKALFYSLWVVGVGVTMEKPIRSTVAVESRSEFKWYLPQEDANIISYLNTHSC